MFKLSQLLYYIKRFSNTYLGNEKPKMGELNRFLTEYCTLWKYIGYKLGLEGAVLDMIQSDCPTRRERFTVVLQKWLELDAKPTWNTLELAITNVRREEQSLESIKESKIDVYIL